LEVLASGGKDVPVATVSVSDQLQKLFDKYRVSLASMDDEVLAAQQKVMNGSKVQVTWAYTGMPSEDPPKKGFVSDVQATVTQLFAQIEGQKESIPNQASALIPIPTYMFLEQGPSPELVLGVYVSRLRLANKLTSDAKLELKVIHPAYGDFVRDNKCYFVNFSDASASQNVLKFPAVVQAGGETLPGEPSDTIYALFPLRTNFSLEINVLRNRTDQNFKNWITPKVLGLDIQSKYIRY